MDVAWNDIEDLLLAPDPERAFDHVGDLVLAAVTVERRAESSRRDDLFDDGSVQRLAGSRIAPDDHRYAENLQDLIFAKPGLA